jgi:Ser/Thr protein kinase RdoA (MazF antagonist)
MSVFTPVSQSQLATWLTTFSVGAPVALEPIAAGIENTNYFVSTTQGRYVLTLFERLPAAQLPFYLGLMAHLARHGIPCPAPIADLSDRYLSELNGQARGARDPAPRSFGRPRETRSTALRSERCSAACTSRGARTPAIWRTRAG